MVFIAEINEGCHQNKEVQGQEGGSERRNMSWVLFGQIVLLIVISAVVSCFVRCMHDSHCKICKPTSGTECEEQKK